jgi:hypothetical protein
VSELIHLWQSRPTNTKRLTKCGLVVHKATNVLWASTAEKLRIPPSAVCKTCYRLGPPWLGEAKGRTREIEAPLAPGGAGSSEWS